jgi:tRNA-dihydrouridine synthase B
MSSVVLKENLKNKLKENQFVLAPMAGITNAPFRLLMKEVGAGILVSELISATGMVYGGAKTLELCSYFEEERPVGLQIFGDEVEHLVFAGRKLQEMKVDFVDINLGCPVPKVVNKGAGSALLKNPEKLYLLLKQVQESIEIPLTIKIRTGWDLNSLNAIENVHAAAEAKVTWVAIHGRTRSQGYEGDADWEFISKVKKHASIPIIGNGDILVAEQAIQRLKESGCDAVMIGRGALRDPFLFRRIAKLQGKQVKGANWTYWNLIERHLELLRKNFKEFYVGIQLRKFLTWYSAGMEGASAFRKKIYAVANDESGTATVLSLAQEYYDRPNLEKQDSYLKEPFLKGGHG